MAWIIPVLQALAAAGSVYQATKSPPKQAGSTQVAPPAGGQAGPPAESVFSVGTPQKQSQGPEAVTLDQNPFLANLAQSLLAPQQPVGTGTVLAPGMPPNMPPLPNPIPAPTPAPTPVQEKKPSIADILGSVPEALAAAAPLLGLDRPQAPQTHVVGAQGGGSGGQMVQGLNLPRRTSIAELLASLPRPRYG